MPTGYVDCGTLAWYNFGYTRAGVSYLTYYNEGRYLNYAVELRNRFKVPMEAENAGQNWSVGRVAEISNGDQRSFAFVIKRLVAGVPSGHEWMIQVCVPRTDGTSPTDSALYAVFGSTGFTGPKPYWDYFYYSRDAGTSNIAVAVGKDTSVTGTCLHYHSGGNVAASARAANGFTGQPTNGQTITIDGKAYTFQTALTDVDGNVLIGATKEDSVDNLVAAINLDATTRSGLVGPGVSYATSTLIHPTVSASTSFPKVSPTYDLRVRAKTSGVAGDSIAVLSGVTNDDSWAGKSTLLGGGLTNSYNFGAGADGDPPVHGHLNALIYVFFPDREAHAYPVGWFHDIAFNDEFNDNRWCAVYNHETPFIGTYVSERFNAAIARIIISGDIIEPRDMADTREEGCYVWHVNTLPQFAMNDGIRDEGGTFPNGRQVNCLDRDGKIKVQSGFHTFNAWSPLNQPRPDGTFDLAPIRIYSSANNVNYTSLELSIIGGINKGYLKKDVIGHQGFWRTGPYMLFESRYGTAIQFSDSQVCPWVTGVPVPFFGWPLNWQGPQRQ